MNVHDTRPLYPAAMTMPGDDYTAALPRKRMGAAVLFRDARGRVLLVEPSYKDDWELPGGTVEADESPRAAARREVAEELGLAVTPGRLLVVDWVPPLPDRTEGVMFVFDGGVLGADTAASVRLPADELLSWAWCTRDEAARRLSPRLARRTAAALDVAAGGTAIGDTAIEDTAAGDKVAGGAVYLEDGV
ncbi:hypothetical protein GCM10018962_82670 [Dactylosporangium matsuzakiense]|uniref:Nudix hydrolase domain-containing protein n=2 Tax=Dactylosporangium matsuzakiense TaxID=53360 RepID=A0A9W6KF71_9ACTN|nr:hypothetical protein GCM10017581_000840 [Dactylosporangium matsuzakiense]